MAFASREAFEGIGSLGPEGPSEVDELANRQRRFLADHGAILDCGEGARAGLIRRHIAGCNSAIALSLASTHHRHEGFHAAPMWRRRAIREKFRVIRFATRYHNEQFQA
jgi:hypothetical protein